MQHRCFWNATPLEIESLLAGFKQQNTRVPDLEPRPYMVFVFQAWNPGLDRDREEPGTRAIMDCKTVRIFAYSSTREQSNKRSGTLYRFLYWFWEKNPTVLQSRAIMTPAYHYIPSQATEEYLTGSSKHIRPRDSRCLNMKFIHTSFIRLF